MKMAEIAEINVIKLTANTYLGASNMIKDILESHSKFAYYNRKYAEWEILVSTYLRNKNGETVGIQQIFKGYTWNEGVKEEIPHIRVIAETLESNEENGKLIVRIRKETGGYL